MWDCGDTLLYFFKSIISSSNSFILSNLNLNWVEQFYGLLQRPEYRIQFISYLRRFSASCLLSIITSVDSLRESLHQKLNAWRALALIMHPSPYFSSIVSSFLSSCFSPSSSSFDVTWKLVVTRSLLLVDWDGQLSVFYRMELIIFKALHVPSKHIRACIIGTLILWL